MAIQSMTGFARSQVTHADGQFTWEIRSVNGKGLDHRLRLPPGFDHIEQPARKRLGAAFSRGNMQVTLSTANNAHRMEAVVNEQALEAVIVLLKRLEGRIDAKKPSLDGILNIRGIVELREPDLADDDKTARDAVILTALDEAIGALTVMRVREGSELVGVLSSQIDRISELVQAVEESPARSPEVIRARLIEQIEALIGTHQALDMDRVHMEAAILATKADLREEIDRLKTHVGAARELLKGQGPVGRKLDFLAQEFNRENNTICSKSNAGAVTAIGLDMKVLIDQFREQIQNLE